MKKIHDLLRASVKFILWLGWFFINVIALGFVTVARSLEIVIQSIYGKLKQYALQRITNLRNIWQSYKLSRSIKIHNFNGSKSRRGKIYKVLIGVALPVFICAISLTSILIIIINRPELGKYDSILSTLIPSNIQMPISTPTPTSVPQPNSTVCQIHEDLECNAIIDNNMCPHSKINGKYTQIQAIFDSTGELIVFGEYYADGGSRQSFVWRNAEKCKIISDEISDEKSDVYFKPLDAAFDVDGARLIVFGEIHIGSNDKKAAIWVSKELDSEEVDKENSCQFDTTASEDGGIYIVSCFIDQEVENSCQIISSILAASEDGNTFILDCFDDHWYSFLIT